MINNNDDNTLFKCWPLLGRMGWLSPWFDIYMAVTFIRMSAGEYTGCHVVDHVLSFSSKDFAYYILN